MKALLMVLLLPNLGLAEGYKAAVVLAPLNTNVMVKLGVQDSGRCSTLVLNVAGEDVYVQPCIAQPELTIGALGATYFSPGWDPARARACVDTVFDATLFLKDQDFSKLISQVCRPNLKGGKR